MTHDGPTSSAERDDPIAEFAFAGQIDRMPKWWAMIAAPAAIAMLIAAGFAIEDSPWRFVLLDAIALALILLVIFRGFPRLDRLEVRRDGIHLFTPASATAVRMMPWRHLAGTHSSVAPISGRRQVQLTTWSIVPQLALTLTPAETHSLAATIHDGLARARAAKASAEVPQPKPLGAMPCIDCGYDRTGLAEGAPCPECGAEALDVEHEFVAWSDRVVRSYWPAAALLGIAMLVLLSPGWIRNEVRWLLDAHAGVVLPTFILILVVIVLAWEWKSRRLLDGPPQLTVRVHQYGLTIERADESPTTVRWPEFVGVRANRRVGRYRMIELIGMRRALPWRRQLELPDPTADLLVAAIHRGIATDAATRRAEVVQSTAATESTAR